MANKQYISIIRLFNHCDIAVADDFNVSRAKKHLQAEFNIASGGLIEVDGFAYTRQYVMEEIDQPDFAKRLLFHKRIFAEVHVLELLEKNTLNLEYFEPEMSGFFNDKEFDHFFSPYFVGPFSYQTRTLLNEGKVEEAGDLLAYEDFLQPDEREEAFRPIRLFLDDSIRTLRNVKEENYKIMRPSIVHWIDTEWFRFMNRLPVDLHDKKNEIVTLLVNIGVTVQKLHRPDCRKMSGQLASVRDLPEHLRTLISSNHLIYSTSTSRINWRGNWWVVAVIIFIFRGLAYTSCNESRNRHNFYPSFKVIETDSFKKIYKNFDSTRSFNSDLEKDSTSFSEQIKKVRRDSIKLR